jgi:hypothetical protein
LASRLLLSERDEKLRPKNLSEDFMKKQVRSLWFMGALALFLSVGMALSAQDAPKTQPLDAQAQQPATPDQTPQTAPEQAQPQSTPEQSQQPATPPQTEPSPSASQAPDSATAVQSFTGTVVKQGDKYVLQDADTGNTYDIDHQDEVAKFEGKRVKVKGTLDASGKMIHVQ